jgi:hypothetical protein
VLCHMNTPTSDIGVLLALLKFEDTL